MTDLNSLRQQLRRFAEMREWGQFHSPKNLAAALIVEAGELLEHFQWLKESESRTLPAATRRKVELEVADVLLYLIRLADELEIDLLRAATKKLKLNARKYPVRKARGTHRKYSDL